MLWGTLLLAIALRHVSTDACLEELKRNRALRLRIGIEGDEEVALAYHITDTKPGDNELVPQLLQQAKGNLPPQRIRTMAYDKAADDIAVHEFLYGEGVKPIIQNRTFQRQEPETVLGGRTPLNVVRDQAGTLFCYDTLSEPPVRHPMAYIGPEAVLFAARE